jgi:hypothetical protein
MKAFDKVPHKRLIKKVENFGITDPILGWIEGFRIDRYQCVSINEEKSEWKEVISGIPKGSVLRPIMFVLYINDLPSSVDSEAYLFADDTKIFRIINNFPEILQDDFKQLETSENWPLKFHPEKCKHIHMQRKKRAKCTDIQTTRA